jgi:hypothetical protein
MAVDIEISGNLVAGDKRHQVMKLEKVLNAREVLIKLGIEPDMVGLIVINGIQSELEDRVPLDCRLCFYPHLSGG